jgi:hypothetical protein
LLCFEDEYGSQRGPLIFDHGLEQLMTAYDRYRNERVRRERLRALGWIAYFVVLFVALLCVALLTF